MDVGANIGQSIDRYKQIFKSPIIHSFEPSEKEFNYLKEKYKNDKQVFLNRLGLGEKEENLELNINALSIHSSFKKLIPNTTWVEKRSQRANVLTENYTTDKILSKVVTLDSYVEKNGINNIDILKIDTQGTEDQIIAGAQKTIKNNKIKLIEFELIFSEIYENPPQIYDFEKNLIPNNYKLFAMSDSGSLIAHYIYQTNMIYICPETYKKFQSKSPYKPIKISDLDMNKKEDRDKYSSFRKMSSKREN